MLAAAAWGGLGPGLLATAIGLVLGVVFLTVEGTELQAATALDPTQLASVGLFAAVGVGTAWLGGRLRAAHAAAAHAAGAAAREARLRLLVDSAREQAIVLLDDAGHVASWNAGAQRLLGWRAQEVLGRPVPALHPADTTAAPPAGEAGGGGGTPSDLAAARESGHWEGEGPRRRRDGTAFRAEVAVSAVRDAGGAGGFAVALRT